MLVARRRDLSNISLMFVKKHNLLPYRTCKVPSQLPKLPLPLAAAALLDGLSNHVQALSTQRAQRGNAPLTRLGNCCLRVLQGAADMHTTLSYDTL